jgi:integrase
MTRFRLKYTHEFADRHGHIRRYVRLPSGKRIPLRGAPGTEEFMQAYAAALASGEGLREPIGASKTLPGTVNAAAVSFYNSAAFQRLAEPSQKTYRHFIEGLRGPHGSKRIATLRPQDVERMLAARAGTPTAARGFYAALRALMAHCLQVGLVTTDPTRDVKRPRVKTAGYMTWDESHIEQFESTHPIGGRERLCFALLLYSGQRSADVLRMGKQHIRGGMLHLRQQKTGATLAIPLHPGLLEILEATPTDHLTFLTTVAGKPFGAKSFTNWFRLACDKAGLPRQLSAHGLRKAACRRLAEAGCSTNVIAAISGHVTLREVARYTAAVDQARLAQSGIDAVAAMFPSRRTSFGNPGDRVAKSSS